MSEPKPEKDNFIQTETEALFRELLAKARHILRAGTVQNQITLIRQVIPVLMKEMQAQKMEEAEADTRDMLDALFADARSTLEAESPPAPPTKL